MEWNGFSLICVCCLNFLPLGGDGPHTAARAGLIKGRTNQRMFEQGIGMERNMFMTWETEMVEAYEQEANAQ